MDSESAEILASLNRGGTIGVGYLGVTFTSIVYGITCIQTFQYYMSPKSATDPRILRMMLLRILDSFQEVLAVHAFYYYLVDNYANPVALLGTVCWSFFGSVSHHVQVVITIIVKSFFIMRIFKLSRNRLLTGLCVQSKSQHKIRSHILHSFYYPTLLEAEQKLRSIGCASLALVVSGDTLIVGSLVYYLYRGRSGLSKSDSMISRIIATLISTSMLSLLIVTANLISYLTAPSQLYVLLFNMLMGKNLRHSQTSLTRLNSRAFARGNADAISVTVSGSLPLSTFRAEDSRTFPGVPESVGDKGTMVSAVRIDTTRPWTFWALPLTHE
ncbi:hypothetical protein BD413DRAFT_476020 [Trametes elegans]|nr:hypothetical protein BD413DRAFT_476020 [Trametes elegans]